MKDRKFRRIISLLISAALILGLVVVPSGSASDVEAADAYINVTALKCYDYAFEVLDYVNEEREKAGLNKLTMDTDLMEAAMQRAAESAVVGAAYDHSEIDDDVAHTRPDGTECFTVSAKSFGENIAYGQSTPFKVMYNNSKDINPDSSDDMNKTSWMRSSGHRSNILNTNWKSVGIGMVYYSGNYYYYWSQEFSPYEAMSTTQRSDRVETTFTVGVTSSVYDRLVSRGKLSGDTMSNNASGESGGSGGSGQGGQSGGGNQGGGSGPVRGKWENDGKGWWFSLSNGGYAKNCWLKSGGNWYAFGEDGYMLTGWVAIDGTWYYFHKDGTMGSNEWVDGYWLSGSGGWTYTGVGSWHQSAGGWWFSDTSGWYASNQWQKIDGSWYYFDGSGYMVTNRTIDGYRLGADGKCQ